MGKKQVFYLDPDERKWTMKDLGLSWDDLLQTADEKKSFRGTFLAKNRKIIDWVELPDHCPECLDTLSYNDEFDSVFCTACDEWRDTPCQDPACEYCAARPGKPSDCY